MTSVSQVEETLKTVMEERAGVLARQTGCIQRERAFSGADLLQTLVFGWLTHPDASLETLASKAAIREVYVSDTAVHKRFNESCARFLHAILEEMVSVLIPASQPVPLELLHRAEQRCARRQQQYYFAQGTDRLRAGAAVEAWEVGSQPSNCMCGFDLTRGQLIPVPV